MKTTNAGQNWFAQTIDSNWSNRVYFINDNTGFITGAHSYKTTNAGTNWIIMNAIYNDSWAIKFIDENTGYIGAYWNDIFKTTNCGINWIQKFSYNQQMTYDLSFVNSQTGFAATSPISKTTNSGDNWFILNNSPFTYSLFFQDANIGWASGNGIYKTTNSGVNWINQSVPANNLYKVTSSNSATLWCVGDEYNFGAVIYKTTIGGVGITQINSEIPSSYKLYQNYPNPFNPSTKIRFTVPARTVEPAPIGNPNITLTIFDIRGNEVATLVKESLQPGTYETTFDASHFSSGIYFYKLQSKYFSQTNKMILLK